MKLLQRLWLKMLIATCGALALLAGVSGLGRTPTAHAMAWKPYCGLGPTATMLANKEAALANPITPTDPPNTPVGVFALDYQSAQTIAFAEDLSRIPTPIDTSQYRWDWNFGDGTKASGLTTSHTYAKPGMYAIQVGIVDLKNPINSDPNFDSSFIHVTAAALPNPPVAVATSSTQFVQAGGTVTFDATGSHSQDGSDLTYTWNFGDTQSATGAHVSHLFSALGKGVVALIVQDKRGAKAVATVPIDIELELPTAAMTLSATQAHPGDAVTFNASSSFAPRSKPGDVITAYQWDFGDGSSAKTTTPVTTHTYAKIGAYTVTLQILDSTQLPGSVTATVQIVAASHSSGGGGNNGLVIGGIIAIVVLLGLAAAGAWWRERQRQLALAARQRARAARRSAKKS